MMDHTNLLSILYLLQINKPQLDFITIYDVINLFIIEKAFFFKPELGTTTSKVLALTAVNLLNSLI